MKFQIERMAQADTCLTLLNLEYDLTKDEKRAILQLRNKLEELGQQIHERRAREAEQRRIEQEKEKNKNLSNEFVLSFENMMVAFNSQNRKEKLNG